MRTMCAADKRCERMPHRRPTRERSVVKHPPYPDLVTGWGVEHGGKGLHVGTHTPRWRVELGWIGQELNCPKASSERCLRKHWGKWVATPAVALRWPKSSTGGLSAPRALDNESSQRNERPAYVQRGPFRPNCGIDRANPTSCRAWMSVGGPAMAALQHGGRRSARNTQGVACKGRGRGKGRS